MYCEIIYIRWTFNFVHSVYRAIHELKTQQKLICFSKIAYNLKSTSSIVHENVYRRQTTKQCAHEMK